MPSTYLESAPIHTSDAAAAARLWALIPCAGKGSRSGAQGPKQYESVVGQPMVMHTLQAFAAVSRLAGTLVVVSAGDEFFAGARHGFQVAACGGATRAQSVANGLQALLQQGANLQDWVLVHDAARCLITPEQINALIDACCTEERSDKWLAQTPQMFRIGALQSALDAAGDAVTDESSAMEAMGLHPLLVHGSAQNFKVTYPQDFALAESVLTSRHAGESGCL